MSVFRRTLYSFVFLISFPLWASSSFGEDWILSSDLDDVKVWQLKTNTDVTGSWQEKKPSKKLDWSKVGTEDFFKDFEKDKIRMLSYIGITEWKAEKYQWKELPSGHELTIEGHYLDSGHKKIAFTEVYLFQKFKTIQILQTRPISVSAKYAEDFFKYINDQVLK